MNVQSIGPNTLLEVQDFTVTLYTEKTTVRAVDHVDYTVDNGEVLAIVGESGSGKTILNLAPLGLLPRGVNADLEGKVRFAGKNLLQCSEREMQSIRGRHIGVIFQDPLSALNPVRKIGAQISEVVEKHLKLTASAADARSHELLSLVGIPDALGRMKQYPHELSGGMRQRVGIAMSIAGEPQLLIADEPTTALDVTVQAQIVSLLKDLQRRLKMAIVLITHDIGVVSGLATKLAVMYAGRLVEVGLVDDVLLRPVHPYTKGLLASVPSLNAPIGSRFSGLRGSPPDLSRPIRGCPFVPRCDYAVTQCSEDRPPLVSVEIGNGRHRAACPVAGKGNDNLTKVVGH